MFKKWKFRNLRQSENQVQEALRNEQSTQNTPHEVVALTSPIKRIP